MANNKLIVKRGFLVTDPVFATATSLICFSTECVSLKAYGIAADLPNHYGYGSVHKQRQPMAVPTSRCRLIDRGVPGTIKVTLPPKPSGPAIAALFTQYGIGEPIERNRIAQNQIMRSQERSFVRGLTQDSERNRVTYFEDCLQELGAFALQHPAIRNVVFPSGVGCRGVTDAYWTQTYLPIIRRFANRLQPNTQVILVTLDEEEEEDEDQQQDR